MEEQIIPQPSEWVKCNLCGNDDTRVVSKERGFNIVRCKICGLVYVNPRLGMKDRQTLYKDVTKSESEWHRRLQILTGKKVTPPPSIPGTDIGRDRDRYYQLILDRISRLASKKTGRLLDIGCGPGMWISFTKLHGWDSWGFDIVEPRRSIVKDIIKDNILVGDNLEDVDLPQKSFDVVTLWHVLEHTPDPAKYIQSANRLLGSGGLLVVFVPNYHWLRLKDWSMKSIFSEDYYLQSPHFNRWGYFFPEEHLYNFTIKTLKAYFNKYGFKAKKVFIDLPYEKKTRLSNMIYFFAMAIAKLVNFITFDRVNIYINLTLFAQKEGVLKTLPQ